MHTGGEPLRVIVDGLPEIKGNTVLEKRAFFKRELDHIRTGLMWEPRGHADMYGCIPVNANDNKADFGLIFTHNEGYSTNCGHAIIAFSKLAVLEGWVKKGEQETSVIIDAPCGRMQAWVHHPGAGKITHVSFESVPSFVVETGIKVADKQGKELSCDIAYGGAYYIYIDCPSNDLSLDADKYQSLIDLAAHVKSRLSASQAITHPFEKDLSFLYGVIYIDTSDHFHSKNMCVFADGEVDRCPTGSGLSGRLALHYHKKELRIGESIEVESIIGSRFKGKVKETCTYGPYEAVIPIIEGNAWVTGYHEFSFDPEDPFSSGFLLK